MFRRQAARAAEEAISDDLIANIPVVGAEAGSTVFVPVTDHTMHAPAGASEEASPMDEAPAPSMQQSIRIAEQLRIDMGEAFARELDRAEQAIAGAVGDMEQQIARLFEQVNALQAENDELRKARERAEKKLRMFQELALEKS